MWPPGTLHQALTPQAPSQMPHPTRGPQAAWGQTGGATPQKNWTTQAWLWTTRRTSWARPPCWIGQYPSRCRARGARGWRRQGRSSEHPRDLVWALWGPGMDAMDLGSVRPESSQLLPGPRETPKTDLKGPSVRSTPRDPNVPQYPVNLLDAGVATATNTPFSKTLLVFQ